MRCGECGPRGKEMLDKVAEAPIHGTTAPGFEEVEAEFSRNFREQDELGAACAVYHQGACRDDDCGGPLTWAPRLRRASQQLLARVRPRRQGEHYGQAAALPPGGSLGDG